MAPLLAPITKNTEKKENGNSQRKHSGSNEGENGSNGQKTILDNPYASNGNNNLENKDNSKYDELMEKFMNAVKNYEE